MLYVSFLEILGVDLLTRYSSVIPAASLQKPMFDLNSPQYLNYGILGSSIGYALMKGLNEFIHDPLSGCANITWTPHEERLQCFADQYDNYFYENETYSVRLLIYKLLLT